MKRITAYFLSLLLLFSLAACSSPTGGELPSAGDSLGREVFLPENPEKIAPTGKLAEMVVFALCPDALAGLSSPWPDSASGFLPEKYASLPILGQLYGGRGSLNPESLLAIGTDLILDIGENKPSVSGELDTLQEQTGIPVFHISADLSSMGECFRLLGSILHREEKAEELASYCDEIYARFQAMSAHVNKVSALYLIGERGNRVLPKGSYHSELFDLMANNLADLDNPSASSFGSEIDPEQLLLWNPDYLILSSDFDMEMLQDPAFKELKAVADGQYAKVPEIPYNWMGFPPSVQRYLGLLWLGKIFYPDYADYDLFEEVSRYFRLFCHCELPEESFQTMMKEAVFH